MYIPVWIVVIVCLLALAAVLVAFYIQKVLHRWTEKFEEAEQRRVQIGDFLTVFAKSLKSSVNGQEPMSFIAQYISELLGAETVCIYEMRDNQLYPCGLSGIYPLYRSSLRREFPDARVQLERIRREGIPLGSGFIGEVGERKQPECVDDPENDVRFIDYLDNGKLKSVMAVPMLREHTLTGVICVVNNWSNKPFSSEQFDLLKIISGQVLMTQDLVHVYAETSRQQRIRQELDFARQLQSSLLPESVPAWDQFAVYAFTKSAKEMNGDFYDFVEIDEDRLLIVLGDACGKGVPACMLTSMTRSFIRSLAENFTDLQSFLKALNKNVYRDSDDERFVTLGCCLLDRRNSVVEYARSGHTDLLYYVRGHIRRLSPDGSALGVLPNEYSTFDTVCFAFTQGMSLLLFSDGITEAMNENGEEFGTERLSEVYRQSRLANDQPQQTLTRILQVVSEYQVEQNDDQTMILIQHI